MALIKFIHSEMALEHQILSLLNLLIGDKFESEFNQNRLRNTFYFVNHPVMQLQLSRRTYDIRCDSCLGRCARDGARDSLPLKSLNKYTSSDFNCLHTASTTWRRHYKFSNETSKKYPFLYIFIITNSTKMKENRFDGKIRV
jgi:hypothetical protein